MNKEEVKTTAIIELNKEAAAAASFLQAAKALQVTTDRELDDANEVLKGVKTLIKSIQEWFKERKDKARAALNDLIGEEKKNLNPLFETERIIKGKMLPYIEEQKRKQREAEEAARRAREEAEAAARAAEEERQRKAREAIEDGDTHEAAKILAEEPEEIIPEPVEIPSVPELKGTHTREDYDWEVEKFELIPHNYLQLDRGKITKEVKQKRAETKIPGIRVFPVTRMSSKTD